MGIFDGLYDYLNVVIVLQVITIFLIILLRSKGNVSAQTNNKKVDEVNVLNAF